MAASGMAEDSRGSAPPDGGSGALPAGATPLPLEASAYYLPAFLSADEGRALFEELDSGYDLQPRSITMADGESWREETGKLMFVAPRLTDTELFPAAHGRRVAWPDSIEKIMRRAAALTGRTYEVCVGIYYPDGRAGIDFHTDLPAFGDTTSIASVSLGAARVLTLRDRRDPALRLPVPLAPGSLLHMGDDFQARYEHALLPDPHCHEPRINLTFRVFGDGTGHV